MNQTLVGRYIGKLFFKKNFFLSISNCLFITQKRNFKDKHVNNIVYRIELEKQASNLEINNVENTCLQMGDCVQVKF